MNNMKTTLVMIVMNQYGINIEYDCDESIWNQYRINNEYDCDE